jgi:uncharacterized membrane protein
MVTPQLKDYVLYTLCDNLEPERMYTFKPEDIIGESGLTFSWLNAILTQFQRQGLIEDLNSRLTSISLVLTLDAYDLRRLGGFVNQEEIVKASLEKLQLEIESLQKSFPDKAESLTTILANIVTIGSFFAIKG